MRDREREHDPSGSTAQFRAFVEQPSGEIRRPWDMRTSATRFIVLAVAVVAVAVVLAIVAISVAG